MIPHRRRAQTLLTRRGRKTHGQFLIEGVRLVEEALSAKLPLHRVYHLPAEPGTRMMNLLDQARACGISLSEVNPDELVTLSDTKTPQGVVAIADIPRWSDEDMWSRNAGDVLILDAVRDPGNVGTLIRTAEAAGARSVVATHGTVELTNPKVVRSAMGAFFRLPTGAIASPEEVARRCREAELSLVVATVRGGDPASVLRKFDAVALVLGGEAEGTDPVWETAADRMIHIPMREPVESLNVAIAGGILLFRHLWRSSGGHS